MIEARGLTKRYGATTAVDDLSFAVDHYNINVNNGISQIGYSNILSLCYNDPNFRNSGTVAPLA